MEIIVTKQLTKRFGSVNALREVDLQLSPGKIYGLVGNNGAGKTTLFRLLAGLLRPSSGNFTLLGESTSRGLNKARKRAGFLIERPIYYPTMSAPSNLRNIQLLLGRKDKNEITNALELVGLNPNSKQLMHNYSMGMQQRYGIAAALIGDPELLILDEPLNGLDPSGVREMNNPMLAKQIKMLPAEDIELITLFVFEQKTQVEISEVFGISNVAVFKRIEKLKKIFREFYDLVKISPFSSATT